MSVTRARPADVWLAARMAAWGAILPLLKSLLPLPRLVKLVAPARRSGRRSPRLEERVGRVAGALYGRRILRRGDNCLERSLVTYRYLSRAGADPVLVVGIERRDGVRGHVWVTVDGVPVHDSPELLAGFERVIAFAAGGETVSV